MKIFYKLPFKKFVKKQIRSFQLIIEDEVEKIAIKPDIGKLKKGDLAGFRVQKFSYRSQ
ncbi:MAG: type II toxin-antitoxin system RelE/ParE family toxin [Deltaproteobacteria bacterium]|nr:type II toxin-antitoxin system RelE/ParE family toxin [Deltaproteobacteria bacterium]